VPVVSKDDEVYIVLAGRPRDEGFISDLKSLEGDMVEARGKLSFPTGSTEHRRGNFPNVSTGISYGGGSQVGLPSLAHGCNLLTHPSTLEISAWARIQTRRSFKIWSSTRVW